MNATKPIIAGQLYRVPYPFCWDTYTEYEFDGENTSSTEMDTWRPGIRWVEGSHSNPYDDGTGQDAVADGMGFMLADIVSVHKPGRFPERIFFVRTWQTPDGKIFGKTKLRITTTHAFRQLIKGYRHEFELVESGSTDEVKIKLSERGLLDPAELPF